MTSWGPDMDPLVQRDDQVSSVPRKAVTIDETAAMMSLSRRKIYYLLAHGELQAVRIGRVQRVLVSSIDDYLAGATV